METLQEREDRIRRLEEQRAQRHADQGTVWPTPEDAGTGVVPIEVAPGRGNLNVSSGFVPTFPTALAMVGSRAVSFARIFMSQPWVAACVMRMLTWSTRIPLRAYRKKPGSANARIPLYDGEHPLATALANPWVGGHPAGLIQAILGPILVHGNAVLEIVDTRGGDFTLDPKDWRFLMPIMPWRDTLVGFRVDVDIPERKRDVSMDNALHCKWWSPTGPVGCSPLQQLGVTLQLEDALQRWQRALLANGARPPSAIVASEDFLGIDPDERKAIMMQLRADLTALYSGPDLAGKPALLPPGLDWKPVGQTTNEAALIEQRKLSREEVCGVYMMPPSMVGILEYAIKSNIQQQHQMIYTECMAPPLVMIEQTINAQVVRDYLQDDQVFCEFDFSAVLRGDPLQEISMLRDAIGSAVLTPNEARDMIHRETSDNSAMDEFYFPYATLAPLGSAPPSANDGTAQPIPAQPGQPGHASRSLHVRSRDFDGQLVIR
jgi:HK97 family phage portal protein